VIGRGQSSARRGRRRRTSTLAALSTARDNARVNCVELSADAARRAARGVYGYRGVKHPRPPLIPALAGPRRCAPLCRNALPRPGNPGFAWRRSRRGGTRRLLDLSLYSVLDAGRSSQGSGDDPRHALSQAVALRLFAYYGATGGGGTVRCAAGKCNPVFDVICLLCFTPRTHPRLISPLLRFFLTISLILPLTSFPLHLLLPSPLSNGRCWPSSCCACADRAQALLHFRSEIARASGGGGPPRGRAACSVRTAPARQVKLLSNRLPTRCAPIPPAVRA